MPNRIRLFHVEDYKIVRDGIRFMLMQDPTIQIIGDAKAGEELFKVLKTKTVDIVILDIYLDGMEDMRTQDGFEICHALNQQYPAVKVIAHSVYDDADRVARIMRAGAKGFVSKKAGFEELIHGIQVVYAGGTFICQETAKKLKNLNEFLAGIEETLQPKDEFFTRREREVLELLAKGYSSRDIARKLFITDKTVESHRKNLVQKAKVKNTVQLITYASMRGFIKK